jgi:hypothetical protein
MIVGDACCTRVKNRPIQKYAPEDDDFLLDLSGGDGNGTVKRYRSWLHL